jgi:ParB family chromosome partitioning protein
VRAPWVTPTASPKPVDLDIVAAGWSTTADNYLGRVTKARILQAVGEARGEQTAQLIGHLKKGDMARSAEELLVGSGWLPEPLRTPGRNFIATAPKPDTSTVTPIEAPGEGSAFGGYERVMAEPRRSAEDEPAAAEQHAVAAE